MAQKPKQPRVPRDLIRRPTAMAAAFLNLSEKMGLDTSSVRVPTKREPAWRVTRRSK